MRSRSHGIFATPCRMARIHFQVEMMASREGDHRISTRVDSGGYEAELESDLYLSGIE
jgi:hypothetical protein